MKRLSAGAGPASELEGISSDIAWGACPSGAFSCWRLLGRREIPLTPSPFGFELESVFFSVFLFREHEIAVKLDKTINLQDIRLVRTPALNSFQDGYMTGERHHHHEQFHPEPGGISPLLRLSLPQH